MKIRCDLCDKAEASVFCSADEAALCNGCDHHVHHANKLASKHFRFSLLHPPFKDSPLCDICQERRAFLFCQEDRAILCRECDLPIHKANEHTQKHSRFLLAGVQQPKLVAEAVRTSSRSSQPFVSNQSSISNELLSSPSVNRASPSISPNIDDNQPIDNGSISTSRSISDYLETLPGWRVDDFLDPSYTNSGFPKAWSTPYV
ncbi:hypothetical protein K2173_013559 [Erythroxylum novogranatense]|uniref:B box-type domain-containing protein n=1 Tax=Erythroxylum novogranatense TaxID=1862640 RepID=A0AAV8TJZ3_9ROSI|nr:hypothetical protein K2173_013559 [Erythroxylum novogranatense]